MSQLREYEQQQQPKRVFVLFPMVNLLQNYFYTLLERIFPKDTLIFDFDFLYEKVLHVALNFHKHLVRYIKRSFESYNLQTLLHLKSFFATLFQKVLQFHYLDLKALLTSSLL